MRKSPTSPPATIPLQYDYQPRMSPSSSVAANIYDNQYTSLFGDPVPPPPDDFLENLDSHLYGSLRRSSIVQDFPKYNSFSTAGRTGTPSPPVRIIPGSPRTRARQGESGGRPLSVEMQPSRNYLNPEIRILPGSGSSSDRLYPPSSPGNRDGRIDSRRQVDVDSDTIYNGSSVDYNWNGRQRRISEFSEDFQGNLENVRRQPPGYENRQNRMFSHEPLRVRQSSNESYSSTDWFKPSNDFQEWSRIPRLRPSSKNVMSINQAQQHKESPVATLINDSNASSSSDDKVLSPEMRAFEITTQIRPKTTTLKRVQEPSTSLDELQPIGLPPSGASSKRDVSPVIMTNAITTGSDYRITTPRPHKKSSFTIIAEKSPQSSRAQSPSQVASGRASPFLGRGFKEPPQRPSSQPLSTPSTTSRLRLPVIGNSSGLTTSDDSPRPSVQFNVSSVSSRGSPTKAHSKGILHNKSGLPQPTSRILNQGQKVRSFETLPRISSGPVTSTARPPVRRLNKSSLDLYGSKQPPEPPKPRFNVNPTSQHRGLLRVISTSADNSPSRIPVRAGNNLGSMDDLVLSRRASLSPIRGDQRRGSTSPERRSSSQTDPRSSITSDRRTSNLSSYSTSDYSFRRGSNSPLRNSGGRRQSIFQSGSSNLRKSSSGPNLQLSHLRGIRNSSRSPRKVAKPTTLSPIIGTPNREGPSSSEDVESSVRNGKKSEANGTKIPVRDGSNLPARSPSKVGSRANSRGPSAVNSRSNSPTKGNNAQSQSNLRITSRDSSRTTSRAGSRVQSRSNSRSNSRVGQKDSTRSSNRGKNSSPPKNRRTSPPKSRSSSPRKTRRKSESPSKSPDRPNNINRGRSRTDVRRTSPKRTSLTKSTVSRKDSPKRANVRKEPASAKKTSSNIKKPDSSVKRTPSSVRKETSLKRETSTLRRSTSNLKKEPLKRESSSLRRAPSNLKREPSNVTKGSSGLKREASNVKKESSGLKREPSNLKRTPSNVSSKMKRETSNSKLKREPSNLKTRTDSNLSLGKKLEKKGSFRNEKKNADEISEDAATITTTSTTESQTQDESGDTGGKLVPLTRTNVVSMTTAAITSQPLHITTTLTNQIALKKTDSSGQLTSNSGDKTDDGNLPATILEKSQKTLENIQKTVTEATDEIHKTINENLTDLKSLESDMGKTSTDSLPAPFEKSESLKTIIENPAAENKSGNSKSRGVNQATKSPAPPSQPIEADVSVLNTKKSSENLLSPGSNHNNNNNNNTGNGSDTGKNHEDMEERVSERAISVLPEVECESANLQSYEHDGHPRDGSHARGKDGAKNDKSHEEISGGAAGGGGDGKTENKEGSGSQEYLDEEKPTGCCGRSRCCQCCSRLCMPFRRCQCCRKEGDLEKAVISEVDEKVSCWKRMKCCNRKSKEAKAEEKTMETISEEPSSEDAPKQGKCRLCLNKFFCCRATNKVEATRSEADEVTKCCFCIPCRRKKKASTAWRERSESIVSVPPAGGRCGRIIEKLKCWKKKPPVSESRRASTVSKKQSIAPTLPPEDTRSKLHVDLVEYNSKMKGAIPVLPLPLAWFCMICNVVIPGLGTLFSGFFCLCLGIPRFSQYDSAKARFGSFIINCIVAVSQMFCVLFCCVGWGWSIWWGTIMLKTARKLKKIKRVEQLEMEEEERQAAANRDVEAGKT